MQRFSAETTIFSKPFVCQSKHEKLPSKVAAQIFFSLMPWAVHGHRPKIEKTYRKLV